MNKHHGRRTLAGGIVVLALSLVASSASAGHNLDFTFSVSPTTAGAVTDIQTYADYENHIAVSTVTHLAPGALLAHANDASSPVSPPPLHGDVVGNISSLSDLWNNGCGNPTTSTYTLTWVEPIGAGAPSGAVAELKATSTLFSKRAFFVYKSRGDSFHSGAHYDIVVPDMPDEFACSGSSASQTTTGYGYARVGSTVTSRVVGRNPSTTGTYTTWFEYKDTSNVTHTDSDPATIT